MKMLQILNGDSISGGLNEAEIPGERLVWREMLAEGPVDKKVGSDLFWGIRARFMEVEYGVAAEKYLTLTKKPIQSIEKQIFEFDEITLWFEYDLFCQINMLACLSWLRTLISADQTLNLVCVGDWPGRSEKVTLGILKPEELAMAWEKRIKLEEHDLDYAQRVWEAWCSPDPRFMLESAQPEYPAFPYLKAALEIHRGRFPDSKTGLNVIEMRFLQWVRDGADSRVKVIVQALQRNNIFGFGDLQYFHSLERIESLLEIEGEGRSAKISLNKTGKSILEGKKNFILQRKPAFLGGADEKRFVWNQAKKRLEKLK